MTRERKLKMGLVLLALAGSPLITTATCDPYTGAWAFYRDDDDYYDYYDGYYYDDVIYYEDCFFACW